MRFDKGRCALVAAALVLAPIAAQTAPTATFRAPTEGQTISGNIQNSSPLCEVVGTNINRVVFSVVSSAGVTTPLNTELYATWNCNIDTRTFPNGPYTLRAVVYDAANASVVVNRSVNISNNTPPAVSFARPLNGAAVSSGAVSCLVNASDSDGIRQLQWFLDGALVSTEYQAPYDSCNIANLTAGSHVIRAVATDNLGATAAAQVTVTVNTPPTVGFSAPAVGATLSGSAAGYAATASDPGGWVSKVDVYIVVGSTQTLVDTKTAAPYAGGIDTTRFADGPATLMAVATDNQGASASTQRSVTIRNAPPPPPPSAGCTTGSTAAIRVAAVPSRVSGVAPLSVFFDASATEALATTRPFHELGYHWDFGDPADGATWSRGAGVGSGTNTKNTAKGPLAAHVYEAPGSYQVCVTVTDGVNVADHALTIDVADPATAFAATNTVCFANGTDFAGCPSGALQLGNSNDFDAEIATRLRTGMRLLFKRGDSWSSANAALNVNGPWSIGAFGTGAKPRITGAGGDILRVGSSGSNWSDGRVTDLELSGVNSRCVAGYGTFHDLLFLRVDCRDAAYGYLFDGLNANPLTAIWRGLAIVDGSVTRITGAGGNSFFGTGVQLAIMGNSMSDSSGAGEHILRSMYLFKAVIAHNTLARPNHQKHSLAIRSPGEYARANGLLPAGTWSDFIVVAGNRIEGGPVGSEAVMAIATDGTHDQRVRNLLVDSNWFTALNDTSVVIVGDFQLSTIRNNIIDLSAAPAGVHCIYLESVGQATYPASPNSDRNWVYNNTCFSSAARTNFSLVTISSSLVTNTTVRNNLGYAPNYSTRNGVVNNGTNSVISNNSSTEPALSGIGDNPNFAAYPPSAPAHFRPTQPSYAIGTGFPVPVFYDFFGAARTGAPGVGAVNP